MANTGGKGKEDPVAKIGAMIEEKIAAALEGRDRKEAEAKDPWARIEGLIDRTISKHFEEFAKGLEEGSAGAAESRGKGDKGDEGGGPDVIRELFG